MARPISRARRLRKTPTPAELQLWRHIRNNQLGHKFRRQVPVGRYIADFACLDLKLIIEVDGETHVESKSDVTRTAYLSSKGFRILRFWNIEVLTKSAVYWKQSKQHFHPKVDSTHFLSAVYPFFPSPLGEGGARAKRGRVRVLHRHHRNTNDTLYVS